MATDSPHLLPLSEPLNGKTLITKACHLYKISLLRVLPIILVIVLMISFMRLGVYFLSPEYHKMFYKSSFVLILFILPLCGMMFVVMNDIAQGKKIALTDHFANLLDRFLSLMGSMISVLLLPAVMFGIGVVGYLFAGMHHLSPMLLLGWKVFIEVVIWALIIPKLFSPILVFTDHLDANTSVDASAKLVKGHYWRTFVYSGYGVLLLILIAGIPMLMNLYAHSIYQMAPMLAWEALVCALLVTLAPWTFALLLVQQYDLQMRKQGV